MFTKYRSALFSKYREARNQLLKNPQSIIEAEKWVCLSIVKTLSTNLKNIKKAYDEASYLNAFWQNYPPEDRGRSPRHDQIPWIEVGEHAIGCQLLILLSKQFEIESVGLPSGPDQRFVLRSNELKSILPVGKSVMVFMDIKSVGPRDDFEHTVISPYQISGDGQWTTEKKGIINSVLVAKGKRSTHPMHCALPPLYVLSTGEVAPTITLFLKCRYDMGGHKDSAPEHADFKTGQPLRRITFATLPNGLLLTRNPNYLGKYPGLLYPGKDDKTKEPTKVRARVSFPILKEIDDWRVQTVVAS